MKYKLSFGQINIIDNHIAEVIIDEGVIFTLEMCEEYDAFLLLHFSQPFAILNNKINQFSYTYEANLHIASLDDIVAVAVVNYSKEGFTQSQELLLHRYKDHWNLKRFSGFQLGRKKALKWLELELLDQKTKA